jgi:hypothetical protein
MSSTPSALSRWEPGDASRPRGLFASIENLDDSIRRCNSPSLIPTKDKLTTQDVVNVLRAGVVEPSEFENGSWRHRVKTNTICVVAVLVSEREAVVVTAWRIRR